MKSYLLILFLLIVCGDLLARQLPDPTYSLVEAESFVQTKNYYLLTLFQQLPEVSKLLSDDPVLSKIAKEKRESLLSSLKNCGKDINCYSDGVKFSSSEIQQIGDRLVALYASSGELKDLVQTHLLPSGCYIMYANLTPPEMLRKAWEQDAGAVNYAIDVYGSGAKKPNYPSIDAISFDIKFKDYPDVVYDCANSVLEEAKNDQLFFTPAMDYALRVVEINDRNRAADYEPMEYTVNKAACERIKSIRWADYKYTLILVPGEGPETQGEPLSALGMLRCRVAAYRWREGLAPFIMVSGGKVHPYKTKFCEAEQMKKYLMETMQVPENAIFMEPHARHTTTNMRNCVREIFRYGMPMEKPCITSTTREQSYYITDKEMQDRCVEELGYSPYKNGKRLSETEAEFYPLISALQIDADEPMDP